MCPLDTIVVVWLTSTDLQYSLGGLHRLRSVVKPDPHPALLPQCSFFWHRKLKMTQDVL